MSAVRVEIGILETPLGPPDVQDPSVLSHRDRRSQRNFESRIEDRTSIHTERTAEVVIG